MEARNTPFHRLLIRSGRFGVNIALQISFSNFGSTEFILMLSVSWELLCDIFLCYSVLWFNQLGIILLKFPEVSESRGQTGAVVALDVHSWKSPLLQLLLIKWTKLSHFPKVQRGE